MGSLDETDTGSVADRYLRLVEDAIARGDVDPFVNPVLVTAIAVARDLEDGTLSEAALGSLVRLLRDDAFCRRAGRLAAYVGLSHDAGPRTRFRDIAARLVRPDPNDSPVPLARFRDSVERTRFSAVFTAHPTFALPPAVYEQLAAVATGAPCPVGPETHRPGPITLDEEYAQSVAAITRGRDAIDLLTRAILEAAGATWPAAWRGLSPRPVTLATWVGYDTDGRTDIGWHDTLRLRLRMKRLQLERTAASVAGFGEATAPLTARLASASEAVGAQIAACPPNGHAEGEGRAEGEGQAEGAARLAASLIDGRDRAILHPDQLEPLWDAAFEAAGPEHALAIAVARAGLRSHGMGLAHTHMRLNATQVHNVARQRLGFTDSPEDPARRRALLGQINDVLDAVTPVPVDFGTLAAEQATAARLMMVAAQLRKHVDAASPVRFLIAETESGYTLLVALWLARLFGCEDGVEISPLFETADALERGIRVIDEAVRSPHFSTYLRRIGKLCLQFGYSDSGRYVGQLAATYQIERLRLRICELMVRRGLTDVEVVLFDTHGESIGRGAHPGSLADRLRYLSPDWPRYQFAQAKIAIREESAFQGGDGYALFGTPALAEATIATIAAHAFAAPTEVPDPIYDDPDFAADFFTGLGAAMGALVEDPGYAALLGAFGPALIDKTGSRPAARTTDASGVVARIRHPRELRAIPNNAILQQLGWCANTLQGLGEAAARHPELFERLREESPRFRRSLDFAAHALRHSDRDVLMSVVQLLDPATWLARAAHAALPARRHALTQVAEGLRRLRLWSATQAMAHRIESDALRLRDAWPDAPHMASREILLHALRQALIARIWLLASAIPYFAPRGGYSRETLEDAILRLDVPAALEQLSAIFPRAPERGADLDFREPRAAGSDHAYAREHEEIFEPIGRLFAALREIGTAIMHEVGAFG